MVVCRPSTRPALTALIALTLLLAAPAPARASCPAQPLDRTFLPWLDPALYEPVPDAGLEAGGEAWTLTGGAAVVDGNDPYLAGERSLALPAGASASTPALCVDLAHPTVRFFARGGAAAAPLLVSAVFRDPLGIEHELPLGAVPASSRWTPSPVLAVLANLLSPQVSFRFTSAAAWQLDDVYVDPYSKG